MWHPNINVCDRCGPCKLIEPLITSTAEKYSAQLSILKYDVEGPNNQGLKVEMLLQGVRVSGLPTLM
jgi:thiol-disulfide isomerase/thioredoxin